MHVSEVQFIFINEYFYFKIIVGVSAILQYLKNAIEQKATDACIEGATLLGLKFLHAVSEKSVMLTQLIVTYLIRYP